MTEFYQFYPNVVALIGSRHGGKTNLMPAVWQTGASKDPMVYVVSISPKRFTHRLIKASGVFSANFIDFKYIDTLVKLGSFSGRDRDKIKELGIDLVSSKKSDVPVMKSAYAAFECTVQEIVPAGDHDLFVGKVVHVHGSDIIQKESGIIDCGKVKPVLYLGKDTYITVDTGSSVVIKR
jgi:flavin reductase (DIM6/NTAB) family NADH-FMN oxidoreductase RutF